ncbi:MAG: PqqD family protein [Candidatus Sumerlaeia bacterium]|nr:PqqD family protein [Candidatus Sumerlaeia bacterium]
MGEPVSRHIKRGELVTREIAGETLIVPVSGNVADLESIYTLNEVGGVIWSLLDGQHNDDQIVDAVCAEFDVERDRAQADVAALLASLREAGLIERAP